jgi:hypothetical protein
MRRFSLLLLVLLAACSGLSVTGDAAPGTGSSTVPCAALKASCDVLG